MAKQAHVLCGGSNGTAFFAALWSSGRLNEGALDVRVVSRRPERFVFEDNKPLMVTETTTSMGDRMSSFGHSGFSPKKDLVWKAGKMTSYSYDDLELAMSGATSVWLCSPVNAYPELLKKIVPAAIRVAERENRDASNPLIIGIMYGQGGVDWMAMDAAGGSLPKGVVMCILKNFPGLFKRTSERMVHNFGYHPDHGWFSAVPNSALEYCKSKIRVLYPAATENEGKRPRSGDHIYGLGSVLTCTLGGSNQLLHPSVIAGVVGPPPGDKFTTAPMVYRGLPNEAFDVMAHLWTETCLLAKKLDEVFDLDILNKLGNTWEVRSTISYGMYNWPQFWKTFLCWGALRGSSRLRAAKMPMVPFPHSPPGKKEIIMNTNSRFIVDDVPYGLCVLMGIAEIVGLHMPYTAAITGQLQSYMGKEYVIVKLGRWVLKGRDVPESGAPQAYGVRTLEQLRTLLLENRLPEARVQGKL